MFIGNLFISLKTSSELFYTPHSNKESIRYHFINIGYDDYLIDNPTHKAKALNITLPFISFTIGWLYLK